MFKTWTAFRDQNQSFCFLTLNAYSCVYLGLSAVFHDASPLSATILGVLRKRLPCCRSIISPFSLSSITSTRASSSASSCEGRAQNRSHRTDVHTHPLMHLLESFPISNRVSVLANGLIVKIHQFWVMNDKIPLIGKSVGA